MSHDPVKAPKHYTQHPSGVECIEITEHMGFCLGNAVKYIWRANLKGGLEDLRKAEWYIQREITRLEYEERRKARAVAQRGELRDNQAQEYHPPFAGSSRGA